MAFSWDEKKRKENWPLRGVDFCGGGRHFRYDELIESIDDRVDYDEERIQALGKPGGNFYVVAYTRRDDTRHIITAWKVGENGRRRYEAVFTLRHSSNEIKG